MLIKMTEKQIHHALDIVLHRVHMAGTQKHTRADTSEKHVGAARMRHLCSLLLPIYASSAPLKNPTCSQP